MQPKLHVQPQALNPNRPAVVVECQVSVVLQIERGEETAEPVSYTHLDVYKRQH